MRCPSSQQARPPACSGLGGGLRRCFLMCLTSGVECCHPKVRSGSTRRMLLAWMTVCCSVKPTHQWYTCGHVLLLHLDTLLYTAVCFRALRSAARYLHSPYAELSHHAVRVPSTRAGRVPSRPEAGEHAAGRAAGAAAEDLRLWVQQVRGLRLAAQVHRGHARLHCARGAPCDPAPGRASLYRPSCMHTFPCYSRST